MCSLRRGLVSACLCLAALVFIPASLPAAESHALIFVGLSANDTQAARLLETARSIQASLIRRGLAPDAIRLHASEPANPLRRDRMLAALALADASPAPSSCDETWLVLLGSAAADRTGQAAFQINGPRFTVTDLAAALRALPGKKYVVAATSASGGFLPPLLALPEVEAVAATAESGQVSEPRFAAFWAEALAADPSAPFAVLAARAADHVASYYTGQSLAQSETARLIDRAGSRIVEAPFSALASAPADASAPSSRPSAPAASIDIAALRIPKATGQTEIERRPADDESRALLVSAREAAHGSPYAALILHRELDVVIDRDFSRRETWRLRAYLRTGEALDDLGSLHLGGGDPFASTRLVAARVIRPDASQVLLNPAARSARLAPEVEAERERDSSGPRPPPGDASGVVHFPELSADCVIEAEWTLDLRSSGELPQLYQEWHFASPYPQKNIRVVVSLPNGSPWHVFVPAERGAVAWVNSTYHWQHSDVPAFEPLPGDPSARAVIPWIGVSSVATWDDFAAWYRRLAIGSDTVGPEVEALAAEIAAAHPDRASRLRAAYERVAALRYVAIELGVGAFRPRTPEQVWRQRHGDCKDKANLLVALLAKLGIPAGFALVNRFDTTFTAFPGWQFNHALARVPAAPEAGQLHDLWLDTTDRLVPFGIIAPGDLGRQALVFSAGFANASFHEITAAQEPPATWTETYSSSPPGPHRIQITATGSAEVDLRRLLLDLSPAQRSARLADLLGVPVSAAEVSDPYDISAPFQIVFHAPAIPAEPAPLAPGLRAFLADSPRPRLWDEGRAWQYIRVHPTGTETRSVPARLP